MNKLFTASDSGDFKVIAFQAASLTSSAELDRLGAELEQLLGEQANGRIVLDFSQVELLATQAIGILVSLNKKVAGIEGGKLVLCGVNPQLTHLLKITRLDRLLKIVKSVREAVRG